MILAQFITHKIMWHVILRGSENYIPLYNLKSVLGYCTKKKKKKSSLFQAPTSKCVSRGTCHVLQ